MKAGVAQGLAARGAGLMLGVCLVLTGCGGDSSLAPVTGSVTYRGQPVSGGRVLFRPLGGGPNALGTIQANGTFALSCDAGDGAQVGDNHVLILDALWPGQADAVSFRAASSNRLRVAADQQNDFQIDLADRSLWQRMSED
jgi:hypothetical protein